MPIDLTNLTEPVVVFEIDNTSFRAHARFLRYLDERRVMGDLKHDLDTGFGVWKGVVNHCYVLAEADMLRIWEGFRSFTAGQEAFMFVHPTGRAEIRGTGGNKLLARGPVVKDGNALGAGGYTMLKSGVYVMEEEEL